MTVAFTHRLAGSDTVTRTTYTTASISPATDGSPIGAWILNTKASTTSFPLVSSITALGLTWTSVFSTGTLDLTSTAARLELWQGVGTASSGTADITNSNGNCSGMLWEFVQMAGAHLTVPFVTANKIASTSTTAATSVSLTLPSSPTVANAILAAIGHTATSEVITAGTNFTKGTDIGMATPSVSLNWEAKTILDTTVDASWASTQRFIAGGIEVAAAAAGATDFVGVIPI